MCCRLKMKLEELWQRTSGCILKIRGVTPDGAGNFELEAGQNVNISEVSNGLRISTTGGVSYYTSDDPQLDIDNGDLKISLVDVAKDSDLDAVAQNVANIINGTTQIGDAAHADTADSATSATDSVNAQYLGSSKNNAGSDTKPIKIVKGQAVAVTNALALDSAVIHKTGNETKAGSLQVGKLYLASSNAVLDAYNEGTNGRTISISAISNAGNAQLFVTMRDNGKAALILAKTPPDGSTSYYTIHEF